MLVKASKMSENSSEIAKQITYKGEKCKFKACFYDISKIRETLIHLVEESLFFSLALWTGCTSNGHSNSHIPSSFSFLSVDTGCPDSRDLFVLSLHEVPVLN